MALKACRECGEQISSTANPCPRCGKPDPHGTSAIVRYGGGFLGAVTVVVVFGVAFFHGKPAETPAQPALAAEPPTAQQPPQREPEPENPIAAQAAAIGAARSYRDALQLSQGLFADAVNDANQGGVMLAIWVAEHGRFSDVAVAVDETTVRKAKKDTEAARGKHLCVRGQVIQIQRERVGSTSLWTGNLSTGGMDFVNFLAGGSTGELVQNSYGRLCGVVVGEYAFSNVSGGQTRSIQVVGMFDLPENKR